MASQLIETLFVSSTDNKMVTALDGTFYHVQRVNEPGQAMEMLRSGQIDLILLIVPIAFMDTGRRCDSIAFGHCVVVRAEARFIVAIDVL